jgi:hypothetical protein
VFAAAQHTGFSDYFDRSIALYTASWEPILLQANVTYWLSIMENDSSTPNTWAWYGSEMPPAGRDYSLYAARYGSTGDWFFSSVPLQSRAFILSGTYVPEPSPVFVACVLIAALCTIRIRSYELVSFE